MLQINEQVNLKDIDEAINHIYTMLKDDRYGNRLTYQRRELLQTSIDDLLDARLTLTKD
jgi:hypothetical protein